MKYRYGVNTVYSDIKLPTLKAKAFDLSVELSRLGESSIAASEYIRQTLGLECEIDRGIGLLSLEYEVMALIALMEFVLFKIKVNAFDVETTNIMLEKIFVKHLYGMPTA